MSKRFQYASNSHRIEFFGTISDYQNATIPEFDDLDVVVVCWVTGVGCLRGGVHRECDRLLERGQPHVGGLAMENIQSVETAPTIVAWFSSKDLRQYMRY